MIYGDQFRHLKRATRPIVAARRRGVWLIGAAVTVFLLASEIRRVMGQGLAPLSTCYILLLAVTLGYVGLWVWASDHELEQLLSWLDPREYWPPSTVEEIGLIALLAATLVALLLAARSMLWYSALFAVHTTIDAVGTARLRAELRRAFAQSRAHLDDSVPSTRLQANLLQCYDQGLEVLADYHLGLPHMKRILARLTAIPLPFGLAVAARALQSEVLEVTSYAAMIAVISLPAAVTCIWRHDRDRRLRPVQERRAGCERALAEGEPPASRS
ncbi:MAG: hypothetical protein R6V05_00865 [Candidatus Brocadiia bacterium]